MQMEQRRRLSDVITRLLQRLALLQGLQTGKLLAPRHERVADRMADLRPFPHSDPAPASLRRGGRRDCGVDVSLARNRHRSDHVAGNRTAHMLALFARAVDVGPVDEQLDVARILVHRVSIRSAGNRKTLLTHRQRTQETGLKTVSDPWPD